MKFIKEYNIAGMAIAFIMGAKVSALVKSLVEDIIMPAVLQPALKAANVENIQALSRWSIRYGNFLSTLIDFILVALVIYFLLSYMLEKFKKIKGRAAGASPEKIKN